MNSVHVTESVVFTSTFENHIVTYCNHVYDADSSYPTFNMASSERNAYNFQDYDPAEMMRLFYYFCQENPDRVCNIRRAKITVEIDNDVVDEQQMREVRQRLAIEKLNEQDIEALGLTKVAVYIKTKFHNT